MSQNPGSATGMEVALPHTGEIVSLEDPRACAKALYEIREVRRQLREMEHDLENAIRIDSEVQGTKTLRYGDHLEVQIKSSTVIDWDFEVLQRLLDAGLPDSRYDDLVRAKVEYTVSVRVADQLSKANPEYKRIIDLARHPREGTHRVSVVRS